MDNLPASITSSAGGSTFSYDPEHARYYQSATFNGNTTNTTYIGGLFEVVSTATDTQYRHNILADGQVIAVHTITGTGAASTSYLHYDHLGSVDTITGDSGSVIQTMSFDAFGLRRDPANWNYDLSQNTIATLKNYTDRGYTDQEQLDNLSLVDMNGRVYDPTVGRFISSDPIEGGNRYAYVDDSPLENTDPSGFACHNGNATEVCQEMDGGGGGYQTGGVNGPGTGGIDPMEGGGGGDGSNISSSGYDITSNSDSLFAYAAATRTVTTIWGCTGPHSTGTCSLWTFYSPWSNASGPLLSLFTIPGIGPNASNGNEGIGGNGKSSNGKTPSQQKPQSSCPRAQPGAAPPPGAQNSSSGITNFNNNPSPPNSAMVTAPNGVQFPAPDYANFQAAYAAGANDGALSSPIAVGLALNADFGDWGQFDFQRNGSTFIRAYTPASNYAVGIGLNGAGYSLNQSISTVNQFAAFMSSNGNATRDAFVTQGWKAAQSGACN